MTGTARWARFRRPTGLVEQTRRLFFLATVLAWLIVVPAVFTQANATTLLMALGSSVVLVGSWLSTYLARQAFIWVDFGYVIATGVFALCCPAPAAAFAFAFCGLWFRGLYGSTNRLVLYTVGTAAALSTAVLAWEWVPGHLTPTPGFAVFGSLPVLFMVMAAARYLGLSLIAREEAQLRDATLVQLGADLLGLTDRQQIYRCASAATAGFCATTKGLCVLVGFWDDQTGSIQIKEQAGPFSKVQTEWPFGTTLADSAARQPTIMPDNPELSAAAGFVGQWLALPLADQPSGWMLLGAPKRISDDVVVAFTSLINQVALALRNSAVHHDLDTQANTDSLTGLMNRAAFTLAVERALAAQPDRLGLMFVDLDDFKRINDGLGHAAGDDLLRHVAARMREAIRSDDLCARLGGDEFAVLLHDAGTGPTDVAAEMVAQRLIDLISAPVELAGRPAQIGASVGVAHASPEISPELLLQQADIAMYAAKAQGKNRFQVFEPGLLQSEQHVRSMAAVVVRLAD